MHRHKLQGMVAVLALPVLLFSTLILYTKSEDKTFRPVLVDTSECEDVADVLSGVRTLDVRNKNILKLFESHTLPSHDNFSCIVNHVFLDAHPKDGTTTTYERLMNQGSLMQGEIADIWARHTASLSDRQQLAIVSCNELREQTDSANLVMLPTTDLSFILRQAGDASSVKTLECRNAFCIVRISTPGCINSKYVEGVLPSTPSSRIQLMRLKLSMMGSVSVMMKFTSVRPMYEKTPEKGVIGGMNATGGYASFDCTCMNEANSPCTPGEADIYAANLVQGLRFVENVPDSILSFRGVEKNPAADNRYDMIFVWYDMDYGQDPLFQQYISGNRLCPAGARQPGRTNTFHDNTGLYRFECVMCGINTHYSEVSTAAPIIKKTQIMYVSSISDSQLNYTTNIRTRLRKYFVALDRHPSNTFREQFRQQSMVDIGTTLVLMMGEPDDKSPGLGSAIVGVECNGLHVPYTLDASTSSISFEVLAEYSGKFISVHINDPDCCHVSGFTTEIFNDGWRMIPVLIFPQPPTVLQECVLCPAGKFSGEYAATDISKCIDIVAPPEQRSASSRALLNRRDGSMPTKLHTNDFKTYADVGGGVFINILEIRQSTTPPSKLQFVFDIETWLDTSNITLVLENTAALESKIFQIYDAQRDNMKSTATRARLIEVGQSFVVILSIDGVYTDSLTKESEAWDQMTIIIIITVCVATAIVIAVVIALVCMCKPPEPPQNVHLDNEAQYHAVGLNPNIPIFYGS